VDAAPGHVTEIFFIDAGGDAHIQRIERGAEGVFADVLPAGFKIEP
jgi:hypothetical protein